MAASEKQLNSRQLKGILRRRIRLNEKEDTYWSRKDLLDLARKFKLQGVSNLNYTPLVSKLLQEVRYEKLIRAILHQYFIQLERNYSTANIEQFLAAIEDLILPVQTAGIQTGSLAPEDWPYPENCPGQIPYARSEKRMARHLLKLLEASDYEAQTEVTFPEKGFRLDFHVTNPRTFSIEVKGRHYDFYRAFGQVLFYQNNLDWPVYLGISCMEGLDILSSPIKELILKHRVSLLLIRPEDFLFVEEKEFQHDWSPCDRCKFAK